MTVLAIGIFLMLVLALVVIWLPVILPNRAPLIDSCRQKTNARIYHQQIIAVNKQFTEDKPMLKLLNNELALGLLTEEYEAEDVANRVEVPSLLLPLLLSAIIGIVPITVYELIGHYQAVNSHSEAVNPFAGLSDKETIDIKLINLQVRIKEDPNNPELWFILAEYYLYHNEFDNALFALNKVMAIEGENNEILAARAMVLYYKNGQRINLQIQQILDYILQKEPDQATALMLIASDYYYQARYREAVDLWQRLLDSNTPKIDRAMLIERINIARMMANQE